MHWGGDHCDEVPPALDCGEHGVEAFGACACVGEWTGADCNTPLPAGESKKCDHGVLNPDSSLCDCIGMRITANVLISLQRPHTGMLM